MAALADAKIRETANRCGKAAARCATPSRRTPAVDSARIRASAHAAAPAALEVHFPDVFAEYERLEVDAVLFSSTGPDQASDGAAAFAAEAQAHAATNSLWVSFEISAQYGPAALAGVIAPDGHWAARCCADIHSAMAITDIDNRPESINIAVTKARPWRRQVRAGVYVPHLVTDNRSSDRGAF